VVSGSLDGYLTAAAAAAGSLIGLLFVAVSLRPGSVFGATAPTRNQMLAQSSFIALVNPFFVSLWGLLPRANLGDAAALVGVIALVFTLRLHLRLAFQASRVVLAFSLLAYSSQLVLGAVLIARPHDQALANNLAGLMLSSFAAALMRAWTLMQRLGGEPAPAEAPVT
jgi:hypothetical protein